MLNFNSILLFSEDPKKLGEFYKKVFEKDPDWDDQGYVGFKAGSCFLTIGPHDKVKGMNTQPDRVLLNFETSDVKSDFERVKGLGAKVIAEPYNPMEMKEEDKEFLIATFADPDGNYFQLMSPMPIE